MCEMWSTRSWFEPVMFDFYAQRQFHSAMSLDDGSVHKNQTNKILTITFPIISKTCNKILAITFPIISKTWSFQKVLAIAYTDTKQFTVTLAATKILYNYPVTLKIYGKLVGCAKLEFRAFGLCTVKKCWFSSCWIKLLSQLICNSQRLTARLLCQFVVCIKTVNCGHCTQIIPHRLADYP